MQRRIVMIGTSLDSPGGMTAVVQAYRAAGLFTRCPVTYQPSYEGPGAFRQVRVMLRALVGVFLELACGRVAAFHIHSASRGSFWRKSIFCVLARAFRVPYIFHLHSGEFPVFYTRECSTLAKAWVRKTLRGAAAVLVLTERWRLAVLEIEPQANPVVLGNPVAVPGELPPLRGEVREVLFLGRLREKKGVFDLVRAMPLILAAYPEVRFVLAGDGELDSVRMLARGLKVEHAVHLPGWIDGAEKSEALGRADIFILPSYFEGQPVGVLEAMATGVPVVATTVGGIPDVVNNEINGLLVKPGDEHAIAEAIVRLAGNMALRAELRKAAYRFVAANYGDAKVVAKLMVLYEERIPSLWHGKVDEG